MGVAGLVLAVVLDVGLVRGAILRRWPLVYVLCWADGVILEALAYVSCFRARHTAPGSAAVAVTLLGLLVAGYGGLGLLCLVR